MKDHEFEINSKNVRINLVDTGCKLNVHKTCPGRYDAVMGVIIV